MLFLKNNQFYNDYKNINNHINDNNQFSLQVTKDSKLSKNERHHLDDTPDTAFLVMEVRNK